MGGAFSFSKLKTEINNSISVHVSQKAQGTANIKCIIKNITFDVDELVYCSIFSKNDCTAEASAANEITQDVILDILEQASQTQKSAVANYFQLTADIAISDTKMANAINSYLEQQCASVSEVTNEVENVTYKVSKCIGTASSPTTIGVVNVGHAKANCKNKTLMNLITEQEVESNQSQETGTSLEKIFMYICIGVAIFMACYVIISVCKIFLKPQTDKIALEDAKHDSYMNHIRILKSLK